MVGMVAGVWAFAELFSALAGFVEAGGLEAVTFGDLLGVPFPLLAAATVGLALITFWLVGKLERRRGGTS
jgi:hypothetical protein